MCFDNIIKVKSTQKKKNYFKITKHDSMKKIIIIKYSRPLRVKKIQNEKQNQDEIV